MRIRTTLATLAAVAAVAGLAAPAAAEVEVVDDPRGDVQRLEMRGARSSADILRLTGTHEGGALTFVVDLADLTDTDALFAGVRMRTPRGTEFNALVNRTDAGTGVLLYRGLGDETVDCPGLKGRLREQADRMVLVVPRSCVQRPRWVRFGATVGAQGTAFYGDDARRDGAVDPTGLPRLGAERLERG